MSGHVITFANIKGGVGKTTALVNLGYLFSEVLKKRVLVIDADDQGNASKAFGVREQKECEQKNLWEALHQKLSYKKVMLASPYERLKVISSTKELKKAQLAFGGTARGLKMFQKLLKGAAEDFDLILIDTKPQINILLQAALMASQYVLIPSFPESDSYDGFIDLLAECEEIYENGNEDLCYLGLLFTNVKNSPAHQAYVEFVKKHLKKAGMGLFPTLIRHSNAIATGSLHHCPAVSLGTSRNVATDYLKVARRVLRLLSEPSLLSRPDLSYLGIGEYQDAADLKPVGDHKDTQIQF